MIKLKRAYDPPSDEDGERVLVERLWPRGVSKDKGRIDSWAKELSPSPELRKWFDHDFDKWNEFVERYELELASQERALKELANKAKDHTVTFVFAAKDEEHCSAAVLKKAVERLSL